MNANENYMITEVVRRIAGNYHPDLIILFGSYARGNPTRDSDLDLLIIKDTDEPRINRARAVRHLFNPQPCPMDILVYTPREYQELLKFKSLIPYIATKEGVVVYEKGNTSLD